MAATNGHRSKLSVEQLSFVGFVEVEHDHRGWAPAGASPRLEQKQAELAALLDTMPGWLRLTRAIVKDDGDKS